MIVDDLIKNPGAWLAVQDDPGVAISSRVRLARNVKDKAFPDWAKEADRTALRDRLFEVLREIPSLKEGLFLNMGELDGTDRGILKERHLISNELAEKGKDAGLVVSRDEQISIMLNEEDHVRLQAISPGMALDEVWAKLNAVDSQIEQKVDYAFSPDQGYLTACPSNVGTGLRASVMLHLPGLRIMDEVDCVIKGLEKMGLAVRGLHGEGTEAAGNMYQISNQSTLGESEETIVAGLNAVVTEIVGHEQNARTRVWESRKHCLLDSVGRAYGVLQHAMLLSFREAVDLLSALRLGVELGLVRNLPVGCINEIMLLTQPAHLQKISGKTMNPEKRDEVRAQLVRDHLARATLSGSRIGRRQVRRRSQVRKDT